MKKINVSIAPDGSAKIETSGFTGTACADETRALEQALGGVSGRRHWKPESRTAATVAAGGNGK